MKIKMLKSQNVAPNGINVERWMKDSIHNADEELAKMLINAKLAVQEINPVKQTEEKKEQKEEKKKDKKSK